MTEQKKKKKKKVKRKPKKQKIFLDSSADESAINDWLRKIRKPL